MKKTCIHIFVAMPFFLFTCTCASLAESETRRPLDESADFWRTRKYCGVTTTYVMLRLNGLDVPYDRVKSLLPVSPSGSNLEDMRLLLRQHNLPAKVVKLSRQELLKRAPFPCIAHTEDDGNAQFEAANRGHFVVLLRMDAAKDIVEFIDGTTAEIKAMPISDFARVWTGYLLISEHSRWAALNPLAIGTSILAIVVSWGFWLLRSTRKPKAQVASLALIAGILLFPSMTSAADDLPTIDSLRESLSGPVSRLESLIVEVKIVDEPLADETIIRETLHKFGLKDETGATAFKGEKRYARRVAKQPPVVNQSISKVDESAPKQIRDSQAQVNAEVTKASDAMAAVKKAMGSRRVLKGAADPVESISALNGDQLRALTSQSTNRRGRIEAGAAPSENHFGSLYFDSIGVYVEDPTAKENVRGLRRTSMLPDVLIAGGYQVSKDRVDGIDCLKLSGNLKASEDLVYSDTMWLDPSLGLMLRQRIFADPKTRRTLLRTVNSNPKEVIPGFWLPQHCVVEEFAPPWTTVGATSGEAPLLRTVVQATKLEANRVPDELFDITFPAGTQVLDYVSAAKAGRPVGEAVQYVMPANPNEIDGAIKQALEAQGGGPSRRWIWLVLAQIVVIPLLILLFYFLKNQFKRT